MRLQLGGLADAIVTSLSDMDADILKTAVQEALSNDFFQFISRSNRIFFEVISYESSTAYLSAITRGSGFEWSLQLKGKERDSTRSPSRLLLEKARPLATMLVDRDASHAFDGRWVLHMPVLNPLGEVLAVTGSETIPSWEKSIGLEGLEEERRERWGVLEVCVDKVAAAALSHPIDGKYLLRTDIPSPQDSLYLRADGKCSLSLLPTDQKAYVFRRVSLLAFSHCLEACR